MQNFGLQTRCIMGDEEMANTQKKILPVLQTSTAPNQSSGFY